MRISAAFRLRLLLSLLSLSLLVLFGAERGVLAADLTRGEKKTVSAIETTVRQAGKHFLAKDFAAAGTAIQQAMQQIDVALQEGSPQLFDALQGSVKRVAKAHTMLEFEGVALPPFRPPSRPDSAPPGDPKAKTEPRPTRSPQPAAAPPTVSFSKAVAPILAARCGRCHIADRKGNFDISSYAALLRGTPEGVVIFPGDVVASRLIETIESGDMPRGGDRVEPQELQTLKAWIAAGAKFDGADVNAVIGAAAARPSASAEPMVRQPTGSETVSFAKQIAPLLVSNCNGCHIDAMQTRGGLRIDTFAQLLRGGTSGAIIQAGNGAASLLVQKLRGTASGERMPAGGRPPLDEASIDLIATWIDEGATLDGASETQPLEVMSQLAWAKAATPAEISERRQTTAKQNLAVALADRELASKTTDNFFVIGPVAAATIELVAATAETQLGAIDDWLPRDETPVYRGRATIIVLPKRYDYSELAKMVEQRSLPSSWSSHWRFDGIDAYVAVVVSDRDPPDTIAGRLAAPIASLAVATRGSGMPKWLADGFGVAATADRSRRRDREAQRQQEAELAAIVTTMQDTKEFLDGKLTPEQTQRAGAAIVASMLAGKRRRGFDRMLRQLADGKPFEQAFADGYGMSIDAYVTAWRAAWAG